MHEDREPNFEYSLAHPDDLLSDLDLAYALRPSRLVVDELGGAAEYVGDVLPSDVIAIHDARQKKRDGVKMRSYGPGLLQEWSGDTPPALPDKIVQPWNSDRLTSIASVDPMTDTPNPGTNLDLTLHTKNVYGWDDRWWANPTEAYTWPALTNIVLIENGPAGVGIARGSGTMVGRHTAVSAAHVFWQAGATWLPTQWWNIARVRRSLGSATQKTGYANNILGCYWVDVPSRWKLPIASGGGQGIDDYSAIDFYPCGINPGSSFGWMNPAWGAASDYSSATVEQDAYDGPFYVGATLVEPLPQNPWTDGWTYDPAVTQYDNGSMLRRRYYITPAMYQNLNGWWGPDSLGTQTIDMTPAFSGSGVLAKLFQNVGDPTYYYTGDWAWFYRQTTAPYWYANGARRLDSVMWNFVSSVTSEW